jgi:cell fate regulator YaaT (PSP1 superfamily)
LKTFLILYGKPRYLGFLKIEEDHPLNKGNVVVVETTRGQELGVIAGPLTSEQEERYRRAPSGDQGEGGQKANMPTEEVSFIGFPPPEESDGKLERQREESAILLKAREMLKAHNLTMKLVDVEYLLDRSKLFFYFTAEQRIDFRGFVRDLAREFKTRIELRQIGGRDEAKVAAGISQCGMPCCCSTWLNRFEPICIKMVKQQNLALNPTKISGICGRLMCCMGYEHTTYQELWKGLPNPGTKLKSVTGETYLISGVDLMGKSLRVFCPDRTEVLVPVGEFSKFRESIQKGEAWEPQREEVVQLPFNKLLQEAVSESETILEDGTCPPERPARQKPVHVPARERLAKRTAERTSRETPETTRGNIPVKATPETVSPPAGQEPPKKRRPRRKKRKNPATSTLNEPLKQGTESRAPLTEPASSSPEKTRRKRNSRRRRPRKPSAEE